jgi:hypothetical protein
MRVRGARPPACQRRFEKSPGHFAGLRRVEVHVHTPARGLPNVDPDVLPVTEVARRVLGGYPEPLPSGALRVLTPRRDRHHRKAALDVSGSSFGATHPAP